MKDIAGIPYTEAQFDKDGGLENENQVSVPAGVTDLFIMSHGWITNADGARELYRKFFESFVAIAQPNDFQGRTFDIVGVIWPSKKFDELVAVSGLPGGAQGSASLEQGHKASHEALEKKLAQMKEIFVDPMQKQTLDEAKALLLDIENKASARQKFVDIIRSLLDPAAANSEDASDTFFKDDGNELMKNLKVAEDDLDDEVVGTGGSASLPLGVGTLHGAEGGAAGLGAFLSGFKAAAMNVLNYTTYFEMKARAGNVGTNGVAKLVDKLAAQVDRIHLIGHSFGGRVVTAAAANSSANKIKSMSLLQTAFSHNGFSKSMKGFFRSVVDQKRVKGPIVVTHTKNDKAVGLAYPLASRINGDTTAAFGDENDKFGGLGRNGAQKMEPGEVVQGVDRLLAVGGSYTWQSGRFHNLESSKYILDPSGGDAHFFVTGKEVAWAISRAMA
jgi:predicted alpha/beta hydrolase family esterase